MRAKQPGRKQSLRRSHRRPEAAEIQEPRFGLKIPLNRTAVCHLRSRPGLRNYAVRQIPKQGRSNMLHTANTCSSTSPFDRPSAAARAMHSSSRISAPPAGVGRTKKRLCCPTASNMTGGSNCRCLVVDRIDLIFSRAKPSTVRCAESDEPDAELAGSQLAIKPLRPVSHGRVPSELIFRNLVR